MSNAIDLQLIADYGGTMLWPMIALSNIAQGSAVLGMIALQKKNAQAQEVNVPACISCYLGVTEPAIFGVNLKYTFPFVCGMIGSACAAIVCVATNTTANAVGVGGIPGILSIQPKYMLSFALCMGIAIAVPFVLTCIVGKKKLSVEDCNGVVNSEKEEKKVNQNDTPDENTTSEMTEDAETEGTLSAFLTGRVIPLKEVGDGVFSEGMMGDGLAIWPESNVVCAPADATVTVLMQDSRHAVGLTMDNGMEILLHVGIDTVDMQGDGFTYLIEDGQRVKKGMPLIEFDREKIKAAGHPDVTICVITDQGNVNQIEMYTGIQAKCNETVVANWSVQ